jgi:cytochrome c5
MKRVVLALLLYPSSALAQDGQAIWQGTCAVCHTEPLSGAPLVTDKAAWAPRLKKGRQALYQSALKGFTGPKGTEMPAKGGNPSLTDAQVKAAVDYMVSRQGDAR